MTQNRGIIVVSYSLLEGFAMLDQAFEQVYNKFKLHFYQKIFSRFEDR